MSIEACLAQAEQRKYTWAGVEHSRECWMGNSLASVSGNVMSSDCNMNCKGALGEICGAGNRLTLYKRNAGV